VSDRACDLCGYERKHVLHLADRIWICDVCARQAAAFFDHPLPAPPPSTGDGVPLWHLAAPGLRATCGSAAMNEVITTEAGEVTCPACRSASPSPSPRAQTDEGRRCAIVTEPILGCPKCHRTWEVCEGVADRLATATAALRREECDVGPCHVPGCTATGEHTGHVIRVSICCCKGRSFAPGFKDLPGPHHQHGCALRSDALSSPATNPEVKPEAPGAHA
jgi:hypothetical protein